MFYVHQSHGNAPNASDLTLVFLLITSKTLNSIEGTAHEKAELQLCPLFFAGQEKIFNFDLSGASCLLLVAQQLVFIQDKHDYIHINSSEHLLVDQEQKGDLKPCHPPYVCTLSLSVHGCFEAYN